jgi:hypothetical protein
MAHQALAEAFLVPALDNPAGRLVSALGNQAEQGQAHQAPGPDNPAPGE